MMVFNARAPTCFPAVGDGTSDCHGEDGRLVPEKDAGHCMAIGYVVLLIWAAGAGAGA